MQALILAAGKGSRLPNGVTNKCFTKILDKSLLDYNLEMVSPDLFSEIIIVVGHNAEYILQYVGNVYNTIPVSYVFQREQLGIANAVKEAVPLLNENFLMCLSDEILINPKIGAAIEYFNSNDLDCICGVVEDNSENIKKAYTVDINENGQVKSLVEKPDKAFNRWKGTGCCLFKRTMLPFLDVLKPNPLRNEYEMGDWIQLGIDNNCTCEIYKIADKNFNINEPNDIIQTECFIKKTRRISF